MTKRISLSFMYYVKYANKTTSYSVFTIYKYVRKRKRDIEKFAIVATSQRSNVLRMVRLVCERQSGAVVNITYNAFNSGCVPYPNILRTPKIVQTKVYHLSIADE